MLKKLQDWYRRASLTSLIILIFLGHSSGNIRYVQAGDTENSPRVWSTQWPDWATVSRDSGKHQLASIHVSYRPFWRKRYFEIVSWDFLNQSAKKNRMSLCSPLQNDPVYSRFNYLRFFLLTWFCKNISCLKISTLSKSWKCSSHSTFDLLYIRAVQKQNWRWESFLLTDI